MFYVTVVIILGHHILHPYRKTSLVDKCTFVLTAPPTNYFLISLPLLWPGYSLRHKNTEIRPGNNPTVAFKGSSERKSCTSLILNQKLAIIRLREEGMSKARVKQGLSCQTAGQAVNPK